MMTLTMKLSKKQIKNNKNNNNIKITEKEERVSNIEEEHDKLLIDSNFIEYRKKI